MAAAFGVLTLWQFYAAVFVVGMLTVFFDVAHLTYLPRLVSPDRLIEGNALLWTNQSVAGVAAPTASGLLIQWLGAPVALLVDALSYLWSALWLGSIRRHEERPPKPCAGKSSKAPASSLAIPSCARSVSTV
jgi:MFS family permease